ncbi:carboxy terminal-processing peptidase [Arenimonas sp.]|uniref:carboxy terminal-processing peptidase n=1 Tax=Arenimonas sp. TaxID=1872635 RepID=UPI0039E45C17
MTLPTASRYLHKRGLWLSSAVVAVLVLGLSTSSQTPINEASAAGTENYAPTEKQRRVSKLVSAVVERSHYRQSAINDPISSVMLDRYLESLDAARSYFLASDIREFERIRYQLDDAVLNGSIDPAFSVFNRFRERNRERLSYALELLKTEPDFTVDESFEYDRSKAPWPKDTAELNELWRKRVKNDALSLILTGKTWTETRDILSKRYDRALKNLDKTTSEDVFDVFMNAFAHVFDPHSNYFSPRESDEFKIAMSLSYEGIGASLSVVDDFVVVQNVIAGGAAAVSGLVSANDRITAVGEGKDGKLVDVAGWRIDDVVQLIRGKGGTTVRLQILPAGAAPGSTEKVISLVRSKISLEAQAAKQDIRTIQRDGKDIKVGVITVPSFYQDTDAAQRGDKDFRSLTRDVRKLIDNLKAEGVGAIVMDLRANGGGNLQEAIGLTGLFIGTGPVVQVRQTGGQIEALDDTDNSVAWDGPLTVVIDRYSASASEIFSGAIQDYGRGLVIGQQSYGKGTVQNVYPLDRFAANKEPGFGQLTITTGKFYRITGESTQHRGVEPDLALPSAISTEDIGESAMESALPWDRIRPAKFTRSGNITASVDPLLQAHNQRVANDPNYQYLLQNIAAYEALRKEKSVSLNLKTRQQERQRQDQERLQRENARRASDGLPTVTSLEELEKDKSDTPDPLLGEVAQITADFSTWWRSTPTSTLVKTSK